MAAEDGLAGKVSLWQREQLELKSRLVADDQFLFKAPPILRQPCCVISAEVCAGTTEELKERSGCSETAELWHGSELRRTPLVEDGDVTRRFTRSFSSGSVTANSEAKSAGTEPESQQECDGVTMEGGSHLESHGGSSTGTPGTWPLASGGAEPLRVVGGMDISFSKKPGSSMACAMLVTLDFPSLELIWEDHELFEITEPYVSGFLAFRESPALHKLLLQARDREPHLQPQIVMIDGNGLLHPQGFGLASQVGVLADMPTIGAAKKLTVLEECWLGQVKGASETQLKEPGDWAPLVDSRGRARGAVMRGGKGSSDPVFVSPGNRVSLSTAIAVTQHCLVCRIPEPVRQADLRSRAMLRDLGV